MQRRNQGGTEKLFGFEIRSSVKANKNKTSPVELNSEFSMPIGNAFTTSHLTDYRYNKESDLICTYRDIALHSEIENAIDEIVNEAFIFDGITHPVSIDLSELKLPKKLNNMISDEFYTILRLLKFRDNAYEIFRRWYIDGRIYFNVIVDEKKPANGIIELRYIDPLQIKLVKQPIPTTDKQGNVSYSEDNVNEYYEYKPFGNIRSQNAASKSVIKMTSDSVVYVSSGLYDRSRGVCISYLDKAIKPLNNLRALEDSLVIFRLARSSLKRAFYIDVSDMSKAKAEQHMRETMSRFRNKVDYDPATGQVRDARKFQAMQEDYWLPRRDGKNTEIDTLPESANLGEIDDIVYMRDLLFQSLNVPTARFKEDAPFMWGRDAEISREEMKFSKFVKRLTHQFSGLFRQLMRIQLSLKGIVTVSDWERMSEDIVYLYEQEMMYHEMQTLQVITERMNVLADMDEYVGKYYSQAWIKREILGQDEQMQKEMKKEMEAEAREEEDAEDLDGDGDGDIDIDDLDADGNTDTVDDNDAQEEDVDLYGDGLEAPQVKAVDSKKDDGNKKTEESADEIVKEEILSEMGHKYTMKEHNKNSELKKMESFINGDKPV